MAEKKIKNLSQKYIDFLDTVFWEDDSWSETVQKLVDAFKITPEYAERVLDTWMEL